MTTTDRHTETTGTDAPATDDPATQRWLPVLRGCVAVIVACSLFVQVVMAGAAIPPLVALIVLFGGAGLLTRRTPRKASIGIGGLGLLSLVLFLPDIARDMADPESAFTFVVTAAMTAAVVVATIGGALVLRRRTGERAVTIVPGIAVAAVVVLAGISLVARFNLESVEAQPGDLLVVADKVLFEPDVLQAPAGAVAIHVDNRDITPHDLTIDELDVQLRLPERAARRVELDAAPGTYRAYCSLPGHERMEIDLVIG
jgi:hypothetical protein